MGASDGTMAAAAWAKGFSVSRAASAGFITPNQNHDPAAAAAAIAYICKLRLARTIAALRTPPAAINVASQTISSGDRLAAIAANISKKRRSVGCNPKGTGTAKIRTVA